MTEFDTSLYESVLDVTADWTQQPPPGTDVSADPAFRAERWRIAAELGWTTILDEAEAPLADPFLIDSAVGAVQALARAGVALPLRQALVARYALGPADLPADDAVLVHPTACGVWAPLAPSGDPADRVLDLAGRPCAPGPQGDGRGSDDGCRTAELADLLLLAEILGAADGAIREARRYVSERVQFGRPLAKIPAVRSSLGELTVAQRELAVGVREAQRRFRAPDDRALRFALTGARAVAATACTVIAGTAHQLHGAMGITGEAGLHRRTTLLWADRDEGASSRDWGLLSLPGSEEELWSLTGSLKPR